MAYNTLAGGVLTAGAADPVFAAMLFNDPHRHGLRRCAVDRRGQGVVPTQAGQGGVFSGAHCGMAWGR